MFENGLERKISKDEATALSDILKIAYLDAFEPTQLEAYKNVYFDLEKDQISNHLSLSEIFVENIILRQNDV